MLNTTYCFGGQGNAEFFRAAADAIDATLSGFFRDSAWAKDAEWVRGIPVLAQNERPQALGFIEVAGAFTIFIATCFGKKIFDEVYDRLLKRPLAPFIDRICRSDAVNGKAIELRDVVYLSDIDLVVVITAAATADTAADTARLFLQAHRIAYAYIERCGRQAPVHCHSIVDGRVDLEPELFTSLQQLTLLSRVEGCPTRPRASVAANPDQAGQQPTP